jgi:beta-alanine degradation protein BauB
MNMTDRPQGTAQVSLVEPHVRVTQHWFAPGAETGWHRHAADYVIIPLLDGDLLLEEPGESRTAHLKKHQPYARPEGVEHNVVNANDFQFSFIEIELLNETGGLSQLRRATLENFIAAWNQHDVQGVMACFTDDCVFWSSAGEQPEGGVHEGRDAVAAATGAIFVTFTDAAWTENRTTIFGDRGLWEWTFLGTDPQGTPVKVCGLDVLEFSGERIRHKNSFRKAVYPRA